MGDFIIETKGLTKKYGEQYAVKNVNMHVKKNTIYGLLGRNGAGKTTVMKNAAWYCKAHIGRNQDLW